MKKDEQNTVRKMKLWKSTRWRMARRTRTGRKPPSPAGNRAYKAIRSSRAAKQLGGAVEVRAGGNSGPSNRQSGYVGQLVEISGAVAVVPVFCGCRDKRHFGKQKGQQNFWRTRPLSKKRLRFPVHRVYDILKKYITK